MPAHPPGTPTPWLLQEEARVIPSGSGLLSRSAQITMCASLLPHFQF